MPYPNFHSARVRDPDSLSKTCRTVSITNGVTMIYCQKKDSTEWTAQAYRFSKTVFTPAQARSWLKEHNIKYILFEPASKAKKDDQEEILEDVMNEDSPSFKFIKKDKKEHIISGIVIATDEIDAEEEFITEEDIYKANISYMTKLSGGMVGSTISHTKRLQLGHQLALIENYIAPQNLKLGDQKIKKGSWIQSYKIFDADLWDMVEEEEIVGFSIGAEVEKVPIEE